MPDPSPDEELTPSERRDYWHMVRIFLLMVLAGLALLFLVQVFEASMREKRVRDLAGAIEQAEREDYAAAMADTYGGKTPQETLELYIAAVEAGDYELASKYFVLGKREKELSTFKDATKEMTENYLSILRETLKAEGEYSPNKKEYSIYEPVLVDFVLYPNGSWKIIEI